MKTSRSPENKTNVFYPELLLHRITSKKKNLQNLSFKVSLNQEDLKVSKVEKILKQSADLIL